VLLSGNKNYQVPTKVSSRALAYKNCLLWGLQHRAS